MPIVRKQREIATTAIPAARRTAAETETSQGGAVARARSRTFETIGELGAATAAQGVRIFGRIEAERRQAALEERQRADDVAIVAATNRLATWERDRLYDPQQGALTTKGAQSFTLPETIDQEFNDLAGEVERSLGTPEQKARFQAVKAQRGQQVGMAVRRHVYSEMQTYQANELKARLTNTVDLVISKAGDPRAAQQELASGEAAIRAVAPGLGLGPEEIEQQVKALKSSSAVGIVDRLLAQDNVKAAQVYFDEAKASGMIAGDQLARIEKALETGQLRKQAQVESDKIIGAGGTEKEWREAARRIDDPQLRDEVMQRVEHEAGVRKRAEQEVDEARMKNAANIVDRTRNVASIPAQEWSAMSPSQRSALRSYAKQLVDGADVETNWQTFYGLMQQAAEDPQAFSRVNLTDHINKLSKQDREQLAQLQLSIRNADRRSSDAVIDGFMTNQQIVNDALLASGLDPSPQPGSAQVGAVTNLRKEVDRQVQALQTRTGKKATNQDVQAIVDELLQTVTLEKGTWLGFFTSGPFTDVQKRISDVTINDMPADLKSQAEDSLRRNGAVPTDEAVLALYRRYLLQQSQGKK